MDALCRRRTSRAARPGSPTGSSPPSRRRSIFSNPQAFDRRLRRGGDALPALQLHPWLRPCLHAARPRGLDRGVEILLRPRRGRARPARRASSTTTGSRSSAPTTRRRPRPWSRTRVSSAGPRPTSSCARAGTARSSRTVRPSRSSQARTSSRSARARRLQRQACITAAPSSARPTRASSSSLCAELRARRPSAASTGRRWRP